MKKKAIFNWSGGKDSAFALHKILQDNAFDITALMTTVNSKYDRISMHGVRRELLLQQGASIGLPIKEIRLPEMPSMADYDNIMKEELTALQEQGVTHSIFGDIFLESLKKYREKKLSEVNIQGHFPIWKKDTTELIHEFIDLGFKTVIVCTSANLLGKEFAGRVIDKDFLKDLPKGVDPCGENGEFHTFVFDGPIFKKPINYTLGETVYKEYKAPKKKKDNCNPDNDSKKVVGFYFADIIPSDANT